MRLLLSLFIIICFLKPEVSVAEPKIYKIGAILSLTGVAQSWGVEAERALAIAQIEANNELLSQNKKIEILFEDSQSDPAEAVTAFKRLTEVDQVELVISDVWAHLTRPLIPLAASKKTPLISPTLMNVLENVDKSGTFYSFGHEINSLEPAVQKLINILKPKTASILCWEDPWGLPHRDLWKSVLIKNQVPEIYSSCQNDFAHDYKAESAHIISKKPDLVITSALSELVKRNTSAALPNLKILTTSDAISAFFIRKIAAKDLEGTYFTDWSMSQSFIEKYNKFYKQNPINEAENSYLLLKTITEAIKKIGQDKKSLSEFLQTFSTNVNGLTIDFKNKPMVVRHAPAELFQIQSGTIKKIN